MTAAHKISLAQQIEAAQWAQRRQQGLADGQSLRGLRGKSVEQFDVERLRAVVATLDFLVANETDIKAFLRLPPDGRKAALEMAAAHGGATT
jgi:hypothetical protein